MNIRQKYRRVSTKDIAYLELKKRILKGELKPDDSIVEERLSSYLGISRTPLREALLRLEGDGLIIRLVNGRIKVSPISVKEVHEIFHVRSRLEGIAIVEAIEHQTDEDIAELEKIIRLLKDARRKEAIDELLEYGQAFHHYIYQMSRNETVNQILSHLNDHVYRYRCYIPKSNFKKRLATGAEHEYIFQFIKVRDKAGAEKAMMEHIMSSLETVVKAIQT